MSRLRIPGRILILALVPLTIAGLLSAYVAVAQREDAAVPATAAPRKVLLDATFDDAQLDPTVFNTCHWWAEDGCTIASNDELEWYVPEQVTVADGALRLTADRRPIRGS